MAFLKNKLLIVFLIIISLIPLVSLLNSGLPLTHDGQDHVARIANFYQSLSEGSLVPRWAGNLNWGYGHPILMFLYPFPSYAASLFHFLGFSFVDSVKIVFGLSFVLSGVFMYLWLKEFLDEPSAIVGSILYNFAPYRFVDLYIRGAIGEHVAFIFPPLICYFLLKIAKESKFNRFHFAGASLSLAALILSHNALLLMFLPFIIIYAIYLVFNSKKRIILSISYLLITFLGFGASSFFLIPAFLEGKYTLRDIVTGSEALSRFVDLKNIFWSSWSFGGTGKLSVQLGILQWALVLGSLFTVSNLFRKEKKLFVIYLISFIFLIGSIFLMLKESVFIWKTITTLQKFQFPWRFLSVSVFMAAILGAFFISFFNKKFQKLAVFAVGVSALFLTYNFWQPKGYLQKPQSFYSNTYNSTTDTGESTPIWSVRFMEKRPKANAEVIAGDAKIKELARSSVLRRYETNASYKSRIRENTLYFPGWKVYIDGKEYRGVQFQDPANRGLITYYVLGGKHTVEIKFENTKLRTISEYISLVSLIIIFATFLKPIFVKSKR